ncbi:MAG: nuclear transport factor 2 family protein [Hyphomicrobiaceae bacterium]|nr:nuclear transport factor 2 family protein [Hyphomicrobiaceae bacterium]
MDAEAVVTAFNSAYQVGDLDRTFDIVADDCVFTMHLSEELVQHAGQWRGKLQIRQAIDLARSNYQYLVYQPVITLVEGDTVQVRVKFLGWHRSSGEQFPMTFLQIFKVCEGKIVSVDEYHDRGKIEAYLRLLQASASERGEDFTA